MNPVGVIDVITFLATILILMVYIRSRKNAFWHDIRTLILGLIILLLFHSLSNFLEWAEITAALDPFEDFVQILEPMFFFFIIYTYIQKINEQELYKAQEFAGQVLMSTPSGIFTVDKNKRIVSWNKGAADITGYTEEDIIGNHCNIFSSPSCERSCALFSEDIAKPMIGKECIMKAKDGTELTLLKNLDILKDREGNVIGGIESFVNITERKKMEIMAYSKAAELEAFNTLAVDRELAMVKLKNEVNALLERAGEEKRYNTLDISENRGDDE